MVGSIYFGEMPAILRNIYLNVRDVKSEFVTRSGWVVISLEEFENSAQNHQKGGQYEMRLFGRRHYNMCCYVSLCHIYFMSCYCFYIL